MRPDSFSVPFCCSTFFVLGVTWSFVPTRTGPMNANTFNPEVESKRADRQRFLEACACRPVDRPPIWLMRQAGRALPEYRALKEKHTFIELVQTPRSEE